MVADRQRDQAAVDSRAGRAAPFSVRAMRFAFSRLGPVLPGLMGALAYRLWFRTHRRGVPEAEQAAAARAERTTMDVQGIPVAVYSWGRGQAVVFVHGWTGRGTQAAAFAEPLLNAGYRLIGFDAPAHGATPGSSTNILEIAGVLQALVDEYGPFAGAISHSFGGMVLAYAMNHGVKIDRAVCINAPARVEFLIERFRTIMVLPDAVVAGLRRRLEQRFDDNVWEMISTDANARELSAPALIIHDADDRDVPWQQGQQIAAAWPGAQFLKTRGLGHSRILRDRETVGVVVDFLLQGPPL